MDPFAIASLSISIASTLTGIVSLVLKKVHNKNKHHKKVTTKITEGDIVKHDHHNKEKLKTKQKYTKEDPNKVKDNKDEDKLHTNSKTIGSDHTDEKLKVIASILSLEGNGDPSRSVDSKTKLKAVATILNLGMSAELSSNLDESGCTKIRFKHTEILEEITGEEALSEKDYNIMVTPSSDGDLAVPSDSNALALVGEHLSAKN
jgi:hypothetical protein